VLSMNHIPKPRGRARACLALAVTAVASLVLSSGAWAQDGERVELEGTFVIFHSHTDGPEPEAGGGDFPKEPPDGSPSNGERSGDAPTDDDPPNEPAPIDDRPTMEPGARTPHGETYEYWLESDGQLYRLRFEEQPTFDPQQPILVIGRVLHDKERDRMELIVERAKALGPAPEIAQGPGMTSVLIIRVFWNQTDAVTEAVAENQVGNVDNNYFQENSYGQRGLTAKATQWFQIAKPTSCDDITFLWNEASREATAAGWNLNAYDRNMIYVSSADCIGRSWGEIGGRRTWIQGTMNTYRTVHELGHNFGLGHAHTLACTDGGAPTTVSDSCTSDEYGDLWNAMGWVHAGESTANHYAAPMKHVLGWFGGRFQAVTSGTYTLAPFESQTPALQGLQLVTPKRTYWIEYRQPLGFDSTFSTLPGITGGALVHITEPAIGSWLVDMTPGTGAGFWDAALPLGKTWTDPERVFALEVTAVSPAGLTVKVNAFPRRWAVVDASGKLVRSAGVLSAKKLGAGRFEVVFNRNVGACGYTATIGDTGNALVYAPGLVYTSGSPTNPNGVSVETKDPAGNAADYPFHLNVNCSASGAAKYAVVGAGGNFVRGGGVVSTTQLGIGRYEVVFDDDMRGCAYTATVGDPAKSIVSPPRGWVFTASGHTGSDGVYVETKNPGGGLTNYPFHLEARCAGSSSAKSAVVGYSGNLVRGDGVLGLTRLGPGRYEARFDANVSACAYTATVGDPSNALAYHPGFVFTAGGHSGQDRVYVETKNPGGGLSDYPFHLAVSC
jgi:hypothetical protein